jgi:hypothetical protein
MFLTKKKKQLDDESNPTTVEAMDAWNHNNFMFNNYILNGLDYILYDVYSSIKRAKTL